MAEPELQDYTIEPERYEFTETPRYRFLLSRRRFVETVGAGVLVAAVTRKVALAESVAESGAAQESISAWLHIAEDGAVTVYTGKVEVGQDIRTSLTQTVADELHVAPARITLVMGDTDLTPFDMGTFGSRTTPQMGPLLRRASSAARTVLLELAAQRWNVPVGGLTLSDGRITESSTRRSLGIGELTRGEKLVKELPPDVPTTPAAGWTIAGTSLPKITGRDIVTGKHKYTSDLQLPGMLIGKVLRAPAMNATLTSLDGKAAEAMPGVVVVRDGNFAGVAAPDELTATRALAALRAEWTRGTNISQDELFAHLKRMGQPGTPTERGTLDSALAAAEEKLEATYTVAYIAHVPLEPRAAVAQWENGKLTVWTATQRPFNVRTELANAFRIPQEQVRVRMPDAGAGYGGKHTGETAVEAARLAQAARKPVKLVWTREEEFAWAYFRPAGVIEVKSGVNRDGTLTAWEFHNYNSGNAGINTSYNVANQRIGWHPLQASPLRQGSYRALAATANTFARETHMDELAERVGMDPLAFRLKNLNQARLRAVLETAAERFGWTQWRASPGHGIGLACGSEKGGYVATCAEVAVERASGRVRVTRVVVCFECGAIVNPDGLRNQVEGAIVMGLGGALWEAIDFADGRILNGRLSQYRVPRFSDLPVIETVLLDRKDLPSAGAGETPIIALAPALGSAIHRATGVRLRALPLVPNGLRGLAEAQRGNRSPRSRGGAETES